MILYLGVTTLILSYLVYNQMPELDIEPEPYQPQLLKLEGPLAVNQELDKSQILLENQLTAPESLAYKDGLLYASTVGGKIVTIKDDKILTIIADTTDGSRINSCPVGIRFHNDDLYVADLLRGLLKVDVKTGKVSVVIPAGEKIGGKSLRSANDLDIADGEIYFSEESFKWENPSVWYTIIEHRNTGRVYKYNIATGKSEVVLDNLYMPNGIQLSHDKKSLLIAEMVNNRILRHHVSGPKKGQTEVFAQLPGEPDNIRPSSRGGYWVAVLAGRGVSSPTWLDRLRPYPKVVKYLSKLIYALGTGLEWVNQYVSCSKLESISSHLKTGYWILDLLNMDNAVVLELSAEGEILRTFHSSQEKYSRISQGLEVDGHMYFGSFERPRILKLKL